MKQQLPDISHRTVIFTNHARDRLDLRKISKDMVIQVMRNPNRTYAIDDGKIKFIGKTMGAKVHAVCKPILEENKWLVITLWVRGEDDAGNFINTRRSSIGEKFKLTILYPVLVILLIIVAVVILYLMLQG
ncbi:MAG: DUF4258 domain-containing protein [Anaerolineaceae bacterium]|nr:DUF4258 domain-containing protein [Anaerolineaceae bacterium]